MTIEKLCELIMDYAKDNDFAIEIRDEQDLDKDVQQIAIDLSSNTVIFS